MSRFKEFTSARPRRRSDRGRDPPVARRCRRHDHAQPADRRDRDRQVGGRDCRRSGPVRSPRSSTTRVPPSKSVRRSSRSTPSRAPGRLETTTGPSAAALAAVELAPAEGAIEPGLIGGPAPGGRTAVLVGYGPKTAVAKRRARKDDAPAAAAAASVTPAAAAPAPVRCSGARGCLGASRGTSSSQRHRRCGTVLAKPPVRKMAKDLGVDLHVLVGSGPQGSITREDVQSALTDTAADVAPAAVGIERAVVRARPRAADSGQGRPQADRREHGGQRVHGATRHRVPDGRHDPHDEGARPV